MRDNASGMIIHWQPELGVALVPHWHRRASESHQAGNSGWQTRTQAASASGTATQAGTGPASGNQAAALAVHCTCQPEWSHTLTFQSVHRDRQCQ